MIVIYLIIGVFAAVLSALPLGASNIAVINTTLKENARQAFKIAVTAGVAEVLLSYYALDCNAVIKDFFNKNMWVQGSVMCILFIAGLYLILKKKSEGRPKKLKLMHSKYTTGFLLGIINPPVLIYWVIAFGVLNSNDFMLSLQSSFSVLFLFFLGVYVGKLLTLFGYSKISTAIKSRAQHITKTVNKITGVLLIIIGFVQAAQLYLS